ncbi:MAG: PAS domain-containing protein [Pseudomonadota bacterium]
MKFVVKKDQGLIPQVLSHILDSCVNGITLSDPDMEDNPIVYANKAFEVMTGYKSDEIIGRNCRFLQGQDTNQEGVGRIREALINKHPVEVTIRNYRKNGQLFYNRLSITPLFNEDDELIYFLGVQYDITSQLEAQDEIARLNESLKHKNQS